MASRVAQLVRDGFDATTGSLSLAGTAIRRSGGGALSDAFDAPVAAELKNLGSRLRRLNLAGTGISGLPKDLSFLSNLEFLDVSGNKFADHTVVIDGLVSLPSLKTLRIDLPLEEHEDQLVLSLAKLENLNGTDLTSLPDEEELVKYEKELLRSLNGGGGSGHEDGLTAGDATGDAIQNALLEEKPFDKADWQGALALFLEHQALKKERPSNSDFDRILGGILDRLKIRVNGISDPFVQRGERLQAHREMFDYIFEDVIVFVHQSDPQLGSVLRHIMQSYGEVFHNFVRVLNDMKMTYNGRIETMRMEIQRSEKEMSDILDAAESLERETMKFEMEKTRIHEQAEADKAKLREEMGWLKTENEKLLYRLRQLDLQRQRDASPLGAPVTPRAFRASPAASSRGSQSQGHAKEQQQQQQAHHASSGTARELTHKQLLDAIAEIYDSKSKFDAKCEAGHLPQETMAKHLYTYLNQKYGLKSLILDMAAAIVNGVKKYEAEDNDVAVFAKILRNEVDEDFRFVQHQLKETVRELLRVKLKGKYPLKSDSDINTLLRKRMTSHVLEEEWVDVVKYMYNHEDSVEIVAQVLEAIAASRPKSGASSAASASKTPRSARSEDNKTSHTDNRVQYEVLLRILLDFQLRGHERFLQRFTSLFHQFDADRNGVLDVEEFKALVFALDSSKTVEEVDELVEKADENHNRQLTFSECVRHLSQELIRIVGVAGDAPALEGETLTS